MLECDVKHYDEWWHFPVDENRYRTVSIQTIVNSEYIPRFSVSSDNSLEITNAHAEDAGQYCCYDETVEHKTCLVLTVIGM